MNSAMERTRQASLKKGLAAFRDYVTQIKRKEAGYTLTQYYKAINECNKLSYLLLVKLSFPHFYLQNKNSHHRHHPRH